MGKITATDFNLAKADRNTLTHFCHFTQLVNRGHRNAEMMTKHLVKLLPWQWSCNGGLFMGTDNIPSKVLLSTLSLKNLMLSLFQVYIWLTYDTYCPKNQRQLQLTDRMSSTVECLRTCLKFKCFLWYAQNYRIKYMIWS